MRLFLMYLKSFIALLKNRESPMTLGHSFLVSREEIDYRLDRFLVADAWSEPWQELHFIAQCACCMANCWIRLHLFRQTAIGGACGDRYDLAKIIAIKRLTITEALARIPGHIANLV